MIQKSAYYTMHADDAPQNPQFPISSNIQKFGFALPGYLIGTIISAVVILTIGAGRMVSQSSKRSVYFARYIWNFALDDNDNFQNLTDPATTLAHKILTLPTYVIGGLVGIIGLVVIGIGRIVTNTFKRTPFLVASIMNRLLHSDDTIKNLVDPAASTAQKLLSIPAYGFTIVATVFTLPVIFIGRVISNSAKVLFYMGQKSARFAMHLDDAPEKAEFPFSSAAQKFGFALPGYVLGVFVSALVVGAITTGRIITNTFKRTGHFLKSTINWVLHPEDQFKNSSGPTNSTVQRILGAPAYVVTALLSIILLPIIVLGRIITNSAKTTLFITTQIINRVLHPEDALILLQPPARPMSQKLMSGLGVILGISIGVAAAAFIALARSIYHSLLTARDISGGILNVTFEREIFAGLKNDRVENTRFRWGLPGILLAVPIAVAGLVIFTCRKIPLLIGIALSPLVALYRGIRELIKWCTNGLRFSVTTPNTQNLKVLFSNLTAWGDLREGSALQPAKKGATYQGGLTLESAGKFFRKAITFNTQTLTEETLTRIYNKLSNPRGHAGVNVDQVVDNVTDEMVQEHVLGTCIIPDSEKLRTENEIRRVAAFAKTVLTGTAVTADIVVPDLYHKDIYSNLFFSNKVESDEAVIGYVVDQPLSPGA